MAPSCIDPEFAEIKHLAREDKSDMDPGVFHVTMKQWLAEGAYRHG